MDDDAGDESVEDTEVSDDEVREALRALRTDDASLRHVLCLAAAADAHDTPLVPPEVALAVEATYALDRDVANGGLDQFVWNQGVESTREVSAALRAVGALEHPDLLDRLAAVLEARLSEVSPAEVSADPVAHFLAFRRAVGGPFFAVPHHREEMAEVLLEYVLERLDRLPDPDAELHRRAPADQ